LLILINKKLKSLSGIGQFVCSIGFIKEKFMEILKKEFFNIIPIDKRMGDFINMNFLDIQQIVFIDLKR
jgi:hypothetical protein